MAGRSPNIARSEISTTAGITASVVILFVMVVTLAGLGIAVVNALAESAWGVFTIGLTIPLAMFIGFYMFRWRKGQIKEATIIGVTIMILGVVLGKPFAASPWGHYFVLSRH